MVGFLSWWSKRKNSFRLHLLDLYETQKVLLNCSLKKFGAMVCFFYDWYFTRVLTDELIEVLKDVPGLLIVHGPILLLFWLCFAVLCILGVRTLFKILLFGTLLDVIYCLGWIQRDYIERFYRFISRVILKGLGRSVARGS